MEFWAFFHPKGATNGAGGSTVYEYMNIYDRSPRKETSLEGRLLQIEDKTRKLLKALDELCVRCESL